MGNTQPTHASSSKLEISNESPGGSIVKNDSKRISECPIKSHNSHYKNPHQYNVYGQIIDPKNQMPVTPNQMKAPDQSIDLETTRAISSIPKGGTDDQTWLYPSPQMFWNALVRKHKVDGAKEEDMETVVAIHNNMNETTWQQILSWERLHPINSSDRAPKLLRFLGRPDQHSPKAQIKMLFGHPAPFDRHDWIVDRGGKEVRYVIDYYHNELTVAQDTKPKDLKDLNSIKSIKLDVRPALDSIEAIIDRLARMPFQQLLGKTNYSPPPFFFPTPNKIAIEKKRQTLNNQWEEIQKRCKIHKDRLQICQTEDSCRIASIDLQQCTANIVCPEIVEAFKTSLASYQSLDASNKSLSNKERGEQEERVTAAYSELEQCLDLFKLESQNFKSLSK